MYAARIHTAGASFVSADGGGTLIGGVVNWTLGVGRRDDSQLHAAFRAARLLTPAGTGERYLNRQQRKCAQSQ
jgi:hypothetical protein